MTATIDVWDEQAAIAGEAAGLRPEQWPVLAHIFRTVAAAEREACAKIADEWGRREDYMNEAKTSFIPGADHSERFASSGIAAAIRARGATTK